MENLSLLIKPVSGNCQLRCGYCFYADVIRSRTAAGFGIMSTDTLELLVARALGEARHSCSFAFQGGEPTLAGLDFYRTLLALEQKYNTRGIEIRNSIQTNGIAIDDAWCDFLTAGRFLVGLSLDGSRGIHDMNRVDASGKGTFSRVMEAAHRMEKHGTEFNILCVVTSQFARRAEHAYRFFKENGFRYLQFIPCIDDFGAGGKSPHSLTPERYLSFLKTWFDLWAADCAEGGYISIRHFDNWVSMLAGYPPEACSLSGRCTAYGVVEADGSVYPCDFYVLDEWKLGDIREHSFGEMLSGEKAEAFVAMSEALPAQCRACRHVRLCRNGCRRDREPLDGGPDGTVNRFCEAYKGFFDYAGDRLAALSRQMRPRQE